MTGSPLRMRRTDRGSATVLAIVLIGALTAATLLALVVGAVLVDHRRAQAAADLAALAGAAALQDGADACAAADGLARANGADLASCEISAGTVLVEVVLGTGFADLTGTITARSRAGPVLGPGGYSGSRVGSSGATGRSAGPGSVRSP